MEQILSLIEGYGATTVLSAVAIYLFYSLNKEREMLLQQLDSRTQAFLQSLYQISTRIDTVKQDVDEVKKMIQKK